MHGGGAGSVCRVSWHVPVCLSVQHLEILRQSLSSFFFFFSASSKLLNRKKNTGRGETPTK